VVLFTHVTTHVDTDPYDTLLSENGFNGFPSVAFLDAQGRQLEGHVGGDKLAGLKTMFEKAQAYAKDVVAKADAGDKAAQKQLLLDRITKKAIKVDEAKKALAAQTDLSAEEKAKVEAALPSLEMSGHMGTAWKDRIATGRKLAEMLKGGRIPSGKEAGSFFSMIMAAAEADKDAKLADSVLTAAKAAAEKDPSMKRMVDTLEKTAAKIHGAGDK
jgi:hypothetical protein